MTWFKLKTGNLANHRELLEPMETLAAASHGPLHIAAENT